MRARNSNHFRRIRRYKRTYGLMFTTFGIILMALGIAILFENYWIAEKPLSITITIATLITVFGLIITIFGFLHYHYGIRFQFLRKNNELLKVVVIGGGTGLSMLLRGLKEYKLDLSAIVTVADDGGSSGRLRDEMDMIPPGDIRNVLIALADTEPLLEKLLQHRFNRGKNLSGHSIGNLLLAALQEITGDFKSGIREMSRVLAVRGQVIPVAEELIQLVAKMKDGRIIRGESSIPKANGTIQRVFLEPKDVAPTPEALQALQKADVIIVGPGSLYTSVLPVLMVQGITEAIRNSTASKVYICNVMTQPGETDRYTAYDHVKAIYEHVGYQLFDTIICHSGKVDEEVSKQYDEQGAAPVAVHKEKLERLGLKVIAKDLVKHQTYLRHDAKKVSQLILQVISRKPIEPD
ncbi:gluconeogenesis factor YvcK family protein [Desulfuribacillus stibiiarsenatis]|uniref:gluconeogenesis factor YvcK family protein n=1 Tax=Desulfuribacillus stibiiarsenatis TaxID=1390249 RepID=UPI000AB1F007|nr:YvcK family protein [Desulfuribacillus stibiiarsenatis]